MANTNASRSRHDESHDGPTFLDVIACELRKDSVDSGADYRFAARRILEDAFRSLESDQSVRRCA